MKKIILYLLLLIGCISIASASTISIPKTINLYNDELTQVYSPNITYSFTIEPAEIILNSNVSDGTYIRQISSGIQNGVTLGNNGTITFTSAAASTSTGVTGTLEINIDESKFPKPGIYRYKITDITETTALAAAGITRSPDYKSEYYLDIYIRYADNALETYGYTLITTNSAATTGETIKMDAFEPDNYYTFNIVLEKQVTGSMGDRNHEFPFAIVLNNNGLFYYITTNKTPINDTTITTTLKHNTKYYIYGLSPLSTVQYTETNDTTDDYVVSVSCENNFITLKNNEMRTTAILNVSDYSAINIIPLIDNEVSTVTYVNNLDEISPTGVVLRVHPYLYLLVISFILIILAIRLKRN